MSVLHTSEEGRERVDRGDNLLFIMLWDTLDQTSYTLGPKPVCIQTETCQGNVLH